jgi:hypothetical protein
MFSLSSGFATGTDARSRGSRPSSTQSLKPVKAHPFGRQIAPACGGEPWGWHALRQRCPRGARYPEPSGHSFLPSPSLRALSRRPLSGRHRERRDPARFSGWSYNRCPGLAAHFTYKEPHTSHAPRKTIGPRRSPGCTRRPRIPAPAGGPTDGPGAQPAASCAKETRRHCPGTCQAPAQDELGRQEADRSGAEEALGGGAEGKGTDGEGVRPVSKAHSAPHQCGRAQAHGGSKSKAVGGVSEEAGCDREVKSGRGTAGGKGRGGGSGFIDYSVHP